MSSLVAPNVDRESWWVWVCTCVRTVARRGTGVRLPRVLTRIAVPGWDGDLRW